MNNKSWLYFLVVGVSFTLCAAAIAQKGRGAPRQAVSSGSLRFSVRLSKTNYVYGEPPAIEATLTNIGNAPLQAFRPSFYTNRLWLDNSGDILAKNYSSASMASPSNRDIVLLAPGKSLTVRHTLQSRAVEPYLRPGKHTLVGEYDTRRIFIQEPGQPKPYWKGSVRTAPLTFTIVDTSPGRHRPTSNDSVLSLIRLKQIGLALLMYVQDYDGAYPPMQSAQAMKNPLRPYVRNDQVFSQPGTNQPYRFNPAMSGRKTAARGYPATERSRSVVAYEVTPTDGTRGVLFADGHAVRLPEAQWLRLKKTQKLP